MLCCAVITGESQGLIEGSCDLEGLSGNIEINAFDHLVEIPRTRESGLPSGRRVHQDITVSKEIDKSTPKLYKALCEHETLSRVEFLWYRPAPGSQLRQNYYAVYLSNAIITRIKPWMPNRLHPDYQPLQNEGATFVYKPMEDISFAYEKIVWSWKLDNIEHEDAWITPDR